MLNAILQLGEYLGNNKTSNSVLEDIVQNPNEKGNYNHVIKLAFQLIDNDVKYKGIDYEQFTTQKIPKYAYKKGSPRGGDYTPTSKVTEALKTMEKLIISFNDIISAASIKDTEYQWFCSMRDILINQKDIIVNDLKAELASIAFAKNESAILSITLWNKDEELYAGDLNIIKKHLLRMTDEQYYSKYDTISKGNTNCYYCKEDKEVFGFVNTYNSYTVDKIGFVSGGFKQENSWKNYPVCSDCAQKLNLGKQYVREYLTSRFSGFDYFVIPKLIFANTEDQSEVYEVLKDFEHNRKFGTNESTKNALLNSEDDFIDIMSDSNNNLNYNMLIFREEQSGNVFRILLYIEDIIPSKLKNILRVKNEIDDNPLFKNLPKKDGTYDLIFGFDIIRYFFPNNKIEGNFDKSFLEILNSIFAYKNISYRFYLNRVMTKLRELFIKEEYIDVQVLQALMSIMFIQKLGLFYDMTKGEQNIMAEKTEKNQKYLLFLENHIETFDHDYKKAVFLLGILIDKLLSIQYMHRGSKPFYSRLNGLKLNGKLVERIYSEAINKLNEYDANYYASLEELISEYLMCKHDLTDDDISYYFVLGLTLGKKFKEEKGENNEEVSP